MESHSVTCHLAEVTFSPSPQSVKAGTLLLQKSCCSMVCLHVCVFVSLVSHAKMAELIEMPFERWTCVCSGKRVLDGDTSTPGEYD